MSTKWLPTIALGIFIGLTGCGSSSPETSDTDGSGGSSPAAGGSASGGSSTGGTASGGNASGGSSTGGSAAGGGEASGGAATGGGSAGGGASTGGGDASGGSASGGDSGGDVVQSKGCGMTDGPTMLTSGGKSVNGGLPTSTRLSIMSGGSSRDYIIDIPADYDPTKPYRLIFSWHQAYGSANGNATGLYPANNGPNFDAQNYAYFGLHRAAAEAGDSAIFVAPDGIGNFPWDYARDVQLFDALLTKVTDNLCIDESRVFTTGFSFGAMMSYALSVGRATKLRGAVTMAAANYNFTQPPSDGGSVAYMGTTGMSDGTCPWVNNDGQMTGGKYCVLQHAEDNGCTIPGNIMTAMQGSKKYVCQDFEGCKEGYPVKVCTFDGNHTPSVVDDGSNGGDDGKNAFIPPMAWEFISQL